MPASREPRFAHVVATIAVAAAVVALPFDLLHAWRDIRNAHAQPRAARVDLPPRSVGIEEPQAIARAASVIPLHATYAVVTGPAAHVRDPQSADYVKFWAQFTLLPRREAPRPSAAQWLLGYGADLRAVGLPLGPVHDLGGGVSVAKVVR